MVTDGFETVAALLSPSIVEEVFGVSAEDYHAMEKDQAKLLLKEASPKLAIKLVMSSAFLFLQPSTVLRPEPFRRQFLKELAALGNLQTQLLGKKSHLVELSPNHENES